MSKKRHEPVKITQSFYQLGIPSFPAYLSLGDKGMLIEGGTGVTFAIIVEQIKELGIEPERIEYLTLTHTHPDHIGPVPHLRRLELGSGIAWTAYHTPGHSPCHISLYEEKERTLAIGDATGFYVPEKDVFWPNYFDSLEAYCYTIRKLSTLPAQRGALSHNAVVDGQLGHYFQKALRATESYHMEMLKRLGNGEDPEKIALDKAEWGNSLTDIQTFEVMYSLAKLMIVRSQSEAGNAKL